MARPAWITEVKWFAKEQSNGRGPEARGSITVADAIYVQFVIWKGDDNGFQVALPRTPNPNFDDSRESAKGNRRYFEEVGCISADRREELNRYVISELISERNSSPVSGDVVDSDIPF